MKKFLKALSVAALLLIMLFCSAGCNFFKSAPVKEFMNKYVGDIPGIYVHTHLLEKHDAVESTCTETGIEAYYSCTEAGCEKLFSDENGENQISEPQIMAKKAHSLTNTVVGNEEYWVCGVCTKIFTDPNGENETVVERVLVGLEVVTMPKDLTYYAGETFSAEGMELKAIYSDNNNETVTEGYTYAPGGALALTDTEVVVSYQGKTVSIPITVLDKSLEKVFVIEAEAADLTGTVNAGTYRGKALACYNIVDIAHASGGKAINNMNAAGNIISWTIHADKDAKAQVVINVAARCTRVDGKVIGWDIAFDEMYTVKVNGVIVPVNMNVTPPKGDGVETENGYYEFCKVSVEIDLKSGDNLISFTVGESAKAGNLDSLVFTTAASLENKTAGMKHSLIAVDEKPATCTEDGYKAYYNCSTCARLFSDAEGKNEISAPESISAKHTLTFVEAKESSCTEAGYEAYYKCVCDKLFSDAEATQEIPAPMEKELLAHSLTKTEKVNATEDTDGCNEYWTCGACKKIFADAKGERETTLEFLKIPATGHIHNGTYVEANAPTCTEDGNIEYYLCTCGKKYKEVGCINELESVAIPASHSIEHRTEIAAIAMLDGMAEHWICTGCNKYFADADGKVETSAEALRTSAWKPLNGVSGAEGVKADGSVTFGGLANSSYVENIFVDENGNSIVGAYNADNANTEYTYSMDITAGGTFHLILFANENSIPVYANADLINPPLSLGFYIRFDATDAEMNVKLQAVLNNSTPEQGIKAKGASSFSFDGTTQNNLRIVLERYNASTLIMHIWVNGEEVKFVNTSNASANKAGFLLRTEWNRNDLYNGIGDSYTAPNANSYPTVACCRGLSETEGYGAGLGLAVTGTVTSNAISGEGQAPVTIANLTVTKTADKATHSHAGELKEGKTATCTEDGYEPYYECACGKLFSDEACQQEIAEPVVVKAAHSLSKTVVESVEYWVCGVCSKIFADENAENETTIARTLLRIEVATMPTILEYKVGDTFKTTGMVLNAIYAEDYVEEISEGYTYTPDGELAVTDKEIVISYQDKTVSIAITVADPSEVIENNYTFEAENAVLSGIVNSGTFKGKELDCYNIVDVAHASGGKMINNMNTAENVISWTVNSDKAAQATITIYVAARCTKVDGIVYGWDVAFDQMYTLSINGEAVLIDTIVSPPKGNGVETDNGYYEICTVTTEVTLTNGENVISLTVSESVKAGNLDCIKVQTTAVLSDTTDGVKHIPTHLEAKASTCIETGYDAHYLCKCGKRYSDAEATNEVGDSVLKELTAHTLTKVTAGTEYWICGVCSKTFSDENGTPPTVVNINGIVDTTNWNTSTDFDAITADGKLAEGVTKSSGTTINVTRLNSRGVGCIGDLKTAGYYATFKIYSDKTEVVGLYVEFSNSSTKNSKDKFNDCYNLIVNGQEYKSDADMPYSSSANWTASNKYTLLGYVQLKEGINEITIKVASGFKYRHNVYSLKFTTETAVISWGNEE